MTHSKDDGVGDTAKGFVFNMTRGVLNGSIFTPDAGENYNLVWGNFAVPPTGTTTTTSTINSKSWNHAGTFNSLNITAQATRNPSTMTFSDLVFSGSGLNVSGAFNNASLSNTGTTSNSEWLVSDVNLYLYDWSLTGYVKASAPNSAGGDEGVKFVVEGQQVNYAPVPEPAFYQASALLIMGGAGFWKVRRKNRKNG